MQPITFDEVKRRVSNQMPVPEGLIEGINNLIVRYFQVKRLYTGSDVPLLSITGLGYLPSQISDYLLSIVDIYERAGWKVAYFLGESPQIIRFFKVSI